MSDKKKPRIIFFDDQETSDDDLAKGLARSFDLTLESPPPLDKLIELYFSDEKNPNGFLTDYRLSYGKLSNGSNLYYSGTMLLLALREALEQKAPNSGISLIAVSQYLYFSKEEEKEDIKKIRELADYIIYKEDYLENPEPTNRRILSVINDLPKLYKIKPEKRSWDALLKLFKPPNKRYVSDLLLNSDHPLSASQIPLDERVTEDEEPDSNLTEPPSHPSRASWTSRDAAKWIVYTLLEYPGILLDSLHASSFLGLDLNSFEKSGWIKNTFKPAKYEGIFHEIEDYWWKYKFQEIAEDLMIEKKIDGPLAGNFVKVCPSKEKIKPNKCVYSKKPGADTVCYFLKLPVRQEHALKYLADDRPVTMDSAYVSRTAYETSDEIIEELIAPSSKKKLREWYKR